MKPSENKILFPVDFEKQSLIGLDYAKYFARGTNAELVLLHVIEEGNFLTKMFSSPEIKEKAYTEAEKMLDELVEKMNYDYPISKIIEYGKVYKKITEVAEKINPKFILMGKTEVPGFARKLVGSNAMHLIQETVFPIVTIRGTTFLTDHETTNRDIVLPVDLQKETQEQITAAVSFAKYFDSKIRLVTVLQENSKGTEMKLLTGLDKAKKAIEAEGVVCTSKLIKDTENSLCKVINVYAKQEDAHLIVIMTQDERRIVDYFVGHNALDIIDNAEIPVLSVVPSSAEDSVFSSFINPLGVF